MANRKCICPRCGRGNKFKGVCHRCVAAIEAMAERYLEEMRVPTSWKSFVVRKEVA